MKRLERKIIIACLIVLTAAVGVISVAMEYRAGSGFHPFQTDRELQNKQVLFPDGAVGSRAGDGESDTESFWKKDSENGEDTEGGSGNGSGYILDRANQAITGDSAGDAVLQGGTGSPDGTGGTAGGNIYGIIDSGDGTGTAMPGDIHIIGDIDLGDIGGTDDVGNHDSLNGSHEEPSGSQGSEKPDIGNVDNNKNENSNNNTGGSSGDKGGGSSGGGSQETPEPVTPEPSVDDEKGPGADLIDDPIKGNGSSSRDEVSSEVTPPASIDEEKSSEFSNADTDQLKEHLKNNKAEVIIKQPEDINDLQREALYKGQTNVDVLTVFQSLEAYIWDSTDQRGYYWTVSDLVTDNGNQTGKHIKITGISFDRGKTLESLPVAEIPEDASDIIIYISYRIDASDAWTAVQAGYKLLNGRVLILSKIIKIENQVIEKDSILNADSQYIDDSAYNTILNLFNYQGELLGADNTGRMRGIFPGWKEDGVLVPFLYSLDKIGRHVLEPSALVNIDTSKYQINLRQHWMNKDYVVTESGGTADTIPVKLQALDCYVGQDKVKRGVEEVGHDYDWIDTLDVPEYVQSVEFDYYEGLSVRCIKIPDTVLYVNTNGIPTVSDDWINYNKGLQVEEEYIVSEDNPRYTAKDGLLYNKDETEILGVPVKQTMLTVENNITKVVLPYQNKLSELNLKIDSIDDLPDINYERLNRNCTITVPDDILSDYINAKRSMIQRMGILVKGESDTGTDKPAYTVKDGFMVDSDGYVHDTLREELSFIEIPDYVTKMSANAINKFSGSDSKKATLYMVIMPADGHTVQFEDGCFDGYSSMTIACYTKAQEEAAEELAKQYTDCSFEITHIEKSKDGFMYMSDVSGDNSDLTCIIPEDIYCIENEAFKDIKSDCLAVELKGYMIPVLIGFSEGTPYSFGIDESKIKLDLSMSSCKVKDLMDNWVPPLTGYYTSYSLKSAIKQELGEGASELDIYNELVKRLLDAENRIRAMLGMEAATGPDDMLFDTPERPAAPVDDNGTGVVSEPAVPKNDEPTDTDVTEGTEKNTAEEEPETESDAAAEKDTDASGADDKYNDMNGDANVEADASSQQYVSGSESLTEQDEEVEG